MKEVIVTGGAGFIGSHLAEELVRKASQVTVIDDLSTGKKENLKSLVTKDNVRFVQGSVTDLPLLQQLLHNASYVFHLAALPSIPRSIENPLASHNANATGTLNVLIAARDNNVEKVIYSSSSSVYGDTPTLPKQEDMKPNPQSPYAAAKLAGEYYCQAFQRVYNLNTVCLRYFNVYGPGQDPGSQYAAVIPRFIRNSLQEKPPIIYGDGKQTRDFTFVDDVVAANIMAADSQATGIFNIGTESSVSINELAGLVLKLTGKDMKPVHQDSRPGDIRHSLAAISKARSFGFKPAYNLEQGLRETINKFNTPK